MGSIDQNGLSEDSILMGLQHIEYLEREINAGGLTSGDVNMLREIEINVNTSLLPDVRLPRILDKIELCALYDKSALMHLVNTGASHPMSRESITASMIVRRDECYFDSERDNFTVKKD
ncbi:T3SS effector NleG family protein [Escherichia albertii]|uniref:T3SS effector NleG family protein n=1 Tax=Escherichia albertii TaxID=208962 RepID=UPI0035A24410